MQLDVDMSPPANIITFRSGLTHLTFDLDPPDLQDMNYCLPSEFLSITHSGLNSDCFAWHPYEKQGLFKTE